MLDEHSTLGNDESLEAILAEYLERLQQDRLIDRNRVHLEHPTYAESICRFLDNHDRLLHAIRGPSVSPIASSSSHWIAAPGEDARDAQSAGLTGHSVGSFFSRGSLRRIGDYEILEEIDRGGMGVVFKARHVELRCHVALKMILSGRLATTSDIDRFQREARAAASLKHPNIVVVHGFGSHRGHHYLSMDFVDGKSLSERLRGGPLPPKQAALLIKTVAEAIHYAHQRDIVHRDLKPANVIVDNSGQPFVTDFGLAKVNAGSGDELSQLTNTGQILGTPSYMSPEQASGRNELVGVASDVYSLGAILYACIAGRAPFVADSAVDTLKQVIEHEPAQPRLVNPRVPRGLQTICLKCLQKEPHRRYESAQAVADDLNRFLDGRPLAAKPAGMLDHTWKWCRRRPDVTALLGLLAVAVLVGFASVAFWWREAERRSQLASAATVEAYQNLHVSLIRQAEAERRARRSGYRDTVWSLLRTASQMPDVRINRKAIRQEAVACMGDFVGLQPLTIDGPLLKGNQVSAVFLNDEHLAVALSNGDISVRELKTGIERERIVRPRLAATELVAVNDGKTLLVADGKILQRWDQQSKKTWVMRWEKYVPLPSVFMNISCVGSRIAVIKQDEIALLRLENGDVERMLQAPPTYNFRHQFGFLAVAASPDGRFVAAADDPQNIFVWDAQTGDRLERIRVPATGTPKLHFTADNRFLILGYAQGIISFECGDFQQSSRFLTDPVSSLASTPNGRQLLLQTDAGAVQLWSLATQRILADLAHPGSALPRGSIGFSPTGNQFMSCGSNRIRVWKFKGTKEKLTLGGHEQVASCVAFNPSAPVVASGSHDGTVKFWDSRSGECLKQVDTSETVEAVAFSPCGALVAIVTDDSFRIWDTRAPEHSQVTYHRHGFKAFRDVRFSADGKWIATCGNKGTQVWQILRSDPGTPPELILHSDRPIAGKTLTFDSSSQYVAVATLRSLSWFALTGDPGDFETIPETHLLSRLVALPDPHQIAAVAANQTIQYWDLEKQKMTRHFSSRDDLKSRSLSLSPSGKLSAVTASPAHVELLDLEQERSLFQLAKERAPIASMAWDPSGRKLAVGLMDGSVAIWNVAEIAHQLYAANLEGDLDLFRESLPENYGPESTGTYRQTWRLVDSMIVDERKAAQILASWKVQVPASAEDANAGREQRVPEILQTQTERFAGAVSKHGAFALAIPASQVGGLTALLAEHGFLLQSLRPYSVHGQLQVAATWLVEEREAYHRIDLSKQELLVEHERMLSSGFRIVDAGGYLAGPDSSRTRYYGVWQNRLPTSRGQLLIVGVSAQTAEENFNYLSENHRATVRQIFFDAEGERRFCCVWEENVDAATTWYSFWGSRSQVLNELSPRKHLPPQHLTVAQPADGRLMQYSGIWRNDPEIMESHTLLDGSPRLVELVGKEMLRAGFRPQNVSVSASKFTDPVAAAAWVRPRGF